MSDKSPRIDCRNEQRDLKTENRAGKWRTRNKESQRWAKSLHEGFKELSESKTSSKVCTSKKFEKLLNSSITKTLNLQELKVIDKDE